MSEFLDSVAAAKHEVHAAKKTLGEAEKAKRKALKHAEDAVEDVQAKMKSCRKYAGISLYYDHVTYDGKNYSLNAGTEAQVEASGSKVVTHDAAEPGKKPKEHVEDNRTLYITVTAGGGKFIAPCKPDDEPKARDFAQQITEAGANAKQVTERLQTELAQKQEELQDVHDDNAAIDTANASLQSKEAALQALMDSATEEQLQEYRADLNQKTKCKATGVIVFIVVVLVIVAIATHFFGLLPE